jgi:hypothetical protein
MPSSLNLRKLTGSASLFEQSVDSGTTLNIAVTVTGAATGDVASVTFPHPDFNQAVIVSIVCSTNTVTVGFTALELDGIMTNAEWTNASATLRVSIIK